LEELLKQIQASTSDESIKAKAEAMVKNTKDMLRDEIATVEKR